MTRGQNETLLSPRYELPRGNAIALADILEKLSNITEDGSDLNKELYQLREKLINHSLSPNDYYDHQHIRDAKNILENYLTSYPELFSLTLKDPRSWYGYCARLSVLWYSASFNPSSTYEKMRSLIAFCSFIIFSYMTYSFDMFFSAGKQMLNDTGAGVGSLCTGSMTIGGSALVADISNQVALLAENQTAILDMTNAMIQSPSLQIIQSFMPPLQLGWFIYVQFTALANSLEMQGNLYISDSKSAAQYFQTGGFPIAKSSAVRTGIPAIDFPLLNATLSAFLLDFCLIIDKGGRGPVYTNSLNVGGEIWGDIAQVLSGFVLNVGVIAIAYTFLTFASHLLKIACEKWDNARRPLIALKMFDHIEKMKRHDEINSHSIQVVH